MSRTAAIIILIVSAVIIAIVATHEHRVAGYAMPLLITSAPVADAHVLFAPCPIGTRNFRRWQERKA